MKYSISFLLALALCWGCISDREPEVRPNVTVELTVRPDPMTTGTRSTDETTIRDLNFYLIDKTGRTAVYCYLTTTTVRFECPPGEYLIRIAANVGRSLGETADLSRYKVIYQQDYDILPMFCEQETTISLSSGGVVQLPPISVKRVVAKISYNLTAKPVDMELKSVQLMSIPRAALFFDTDVPASVNSDDYTDSAETRLSGAQAAGLFYTLPNLQGVNPSITDQKQKNADNAPAHATYLRIRAVRGNKILDYLVYLGENNTDNFDVKANTSYTLNITICGDNETDVRVRCYTVNVECHIDAISQTGNIYLSFAPITLNVTLGGKYADMGLHAKLEVKAGNIEYFNFNGNGGQAINEIPSLSESTSYKVRYKPQSFTRENMFLDYTVSVFDCYGWVVDFDFSYTFAYAVQVYTRWRDGRNGAGTITSPDAVSSTETIGPSSSYYTFFCSAEGCTLHAKPSDNGEFYGWYTRANDTGFLTLEQTYKYVPETSLKTLYASFK